MRCFGYAMIRLDLAKNCLIPIDAKAIGFDYRSVGRAYKVTGNQGNVLESVFKLQYGKLSVVVDTIDFDFYRTRAQAHAECARRYKTIKEFVEKTW